MNLLRKFIITTILLVTVILDISSSTKPVNYELYTNMSTQELLDISYDYFYRDVPDSALTPLNIIIQRYNKNMNDEEKMTCCYAYIYMFYIHFYQYFYYSKGYEYLEKAMEIRDEVGLIDPTIDWYLAHYYYTLSTFYDDKSLSKNVIHYLKKALDSAYKTKNKTEYNNIFNLLILSVYVYDDINTGDIEKEWEKYRKQNINNNDSVYILNDMLYRLFYSTNKINNVASLQLSDSILNFTESSFRFSKSRIYTYLQRARIYARNGEYKLAINQIKLMEELSDDVNSMDSKLIAYLSYSKYYDQLGDKDKAGKYRIKYYAIKDTLLYERQVVAMSKKDVVDELSEFTNTLNKEKLNAVRTRNNVVISLVVIVFIVILIVIVRKKKLRKEETAGTNDGKPSEKYQGYKLEEDYINDLLNKIIGVMENVDEISSPTFSLERLAELTDSNYKYVSQVINDKMGLNFNQLLNKYRIEEVCRRMSDKENYGMYTTEGIAESVGFKSRSTFVISFKKFTGVTPSQYKKNLK